MTTRREILIASGAVALAVPLSSFPQQQPQKAYRIGFMHASNPNAYSKQFEAFLAELRSLGYVDGKNITIETRWADGKYERLPDLASDLVRSNIKVFVANGTPGTLAAKRATTTIPIVTLVGDAVAGGIVTNLARPTENVTGLTYNSLDLYAKRLELLKEIFPTTRQFGCLLNPDNSSYTRIFRALEAAGKALKVEVYQFEARTLGDFETAFSAMRQKRVAVLVVQEESFFNSNVRTITELAVRQRINSIGSKEFAEAGGLIGYGPNLIAMYGRMAYFVDRLLRDAKVADLPIEQASRLELVINMKTVKMLGATIPQPVFVRAERVIE